MEGTNPVASLPIPPSYQVLHKLKEWDDCQTRALNDRNDESTRLARKELMSMLKTLRYTKPTFQHDPNYDSKLHNESAARVDRFFTAHTSYMNEWQQMGFFGGPKAQIKPKQSNPGHMEIRRLAAHTTVTILTELGLPCAIFGSMACKLYGNSRVPNDIDILVLPPPERASITQGEIKALIVEHAPANYHFFLKPARDPQATYNVLYFVAKPASISTGAFVSEEFTSTSTHIPRTYSSKVDILLPGIMNLPALPTSLITQKHLLPIVPFPVLILQKLQGWADHSAATEARYRAKIGVDGRDLEWCLNSGTVKRHLSRYKNHKSPKEPWKELWSDGRMFSEEFEEISKVRVVEFCKVYEGLKEAWRAIGFDV